jgi:thioredoxin reductase (NADPH)
MYVVLSGVVRISARDGHGHDIPLVDIGPGGFSGEIGSLSGGRAFVDGRAVGAGRGVADSFRRVAGGARRGGRAGRANHARPDSPPRRHPRDRRGWPGADRGSPTCVGRRAVCANFLSRNGIPHMLFDPATDPDAHALIERYAPRPGDMPLVVCPDGSVLHNPTESVLGSPSACSTPAARTKYTTWPSPARAPRVSRRRSTRPRKGSRSS